MVRKIFLLILILSFKFYAQSIEVFASTDTTAYLVGDYIKYRIELAYDEGIRIDSIHVRDSVKVLDFVSEKAVQTGNKGNKKLEIHDYVFSKYDSSVVTIPAIPIQYYVNDEKTPSTIFTNEVTLSVSTLPVNPNGKIQDVKSPLRIPFDWKIIALIVLAVLILLSLIYYFYRRYKLKKSGMEKIIKRIEVPPHKEALKRLYDLRDKKLWQQGMVKEYHSEITGIVRNYFERRFSVKALEITTSEIISELKEINEAGVILDAVRNFLDNADLVKFAKFEPMPSVNEEMMEQAINIVKLTEPKEAEEKLVEEKADVQ
jgi:hypothetical protein